MRLLFCIDIVLHNNVFVDLCSTTLYHINEGYMSVLSDSILDDLKRNRSNQKLYLDQIASLPKGKIIIRSRRNKEYYYLEYRDGKRVIYDYLGSVSGFDTASLQEQLNERKIYSERLKNLKREEKEMIRILSVLGVNYE